MEGKSEWADDADHDINKLDEEINKLTHSVEELEESMGKEMETYKSTCERISELEKMKLHNDLVMEEKEKRRLLDEQMEKNRLLAEEAEAMEEQIFMYDANDLFELIKTGFYVSRIVTDKDLEKPTLEKKFSIRTNSDGSNAEMRMTWREGRIMVKPARHQDYMLSFPAMQIVDPKFRPDPRANKVRGSAHRLGHFDNEGAQEIRTTRGGKINKKPFQPPLKRSGRCPDVMVNGKVQASKRVTNAGASR